MKKSVLLTLLIGLLTLTATIALAAEIQVGGGGAACRGLFAAVAEFFQAETGIVVKVKPSTPGQGLIELNDGHVDVATAAVPFDSMVRGAAKNGITINPSQFTVCEIGTNKTLVFTHKSNKVKALSKEQLQDIFTGKVTNWKQVGGEDQEIVVVWGLATPGQNELFSKHVLEGKSITPNHKELTDYTSIRDFVAQNQGAVGIDPQGFVSSGTKNPQTPLVTSKVIAVTKGKPSAEVDKLLKFVKEYN
jgi:phosphate transport system substrate-binding protein